jgi:hypothetical protein
MRSAWLTRSIFLGVTVLCISSVVLAQNPTTFRVNMKIKMREGTFQPGSGDIVRVAGSFNDWGNSVDTLRDVAPIDSIYEKTVSLAAAGIQYKFLKSLRGGLDWEGGSNRTYTVVAGTNSLPAVYFDYDSVFTPPVNANVTFKVNMRVKRLEGQFRPDLGDIVRVAGSFNNWGSSTDTLRDIAPIDSIYEKTIPLLENTALAFKFLKTPRNGDWEDGDNRTYNVPIGGGTYGPFFFNNDSVINAPITANILFQLDMGAYQTLGWFNPAARDTLEIRGAFNGWGTTPRAVMRPNQFRPSVFEYTLAYTGNQGDQFPHKFYMDLDSAGAVNRFPLWNTGRDDHNYEHPAERGDGNRVFTINAGGNVPTPLYYYSSINPGGLMLNTNDSCRVTFRVNMGPATRYTVPFNPSADTVYLRVYDQLWRSAQIARQGAFPELWRMTRQGPTDSVFTVTFTVRGRTHYNVLYHYRFIKAAGGGTIDEGGGLGVQNPYRSRFIVPTSPNVFPPAYTMALDNWQKDAPLPAQTPPYSITNGVEEEKGTGVPTGFTLSQNYPNPFNPTTYIKYSIPQATKVSLKVYNLIGQEVATLVNDTQAAGNYIASFEANSLASGVYFFKLEAGTFRDTKKMLLLK